MSRNQQRIKVLHHLGGLQRAGIETWLLHVRRRAEERGIDMDFLVRESEPGDYQQEMERRGSIVGPGVPHRNPLEFISVAQRFMQANGPYDVVHSHIGQYDGLMLWVAARAGVPVRISHSHNDTRRLKRNGNPAWKLCGECARYLIAKNATHCLAASSEAAASLIRCGIDLSVFEKPNLDRRAQLRKEFDIPIDALVVGHVGRFDPQKNHHFLVSIAQELLRRRPGAYLVMIGRGPLKDDIEASIKAAGSADRVRILEPRQDIPSVMSHALDAFLLPSLYEGLPLVLLEAQAAGLPCLVADTVSPESRVDNRLVKFLPLSSPVSTWVDDLTLADRPPSFREPVLRGSAFDVEVSAAQLFALYREALQEAMPSLKVARYA
jgi:glycosyltransferase involved in cell wall biosynthesis